MASKGLHAALRPGLCEILQTDFHEKALFVKGRRGGLFEVERNGSMSFALCFHPHF